MGITEKAAVAAPIKARVRTRIGRKVTVAATPNATRSPIIWDGEGHLSVSVSLPSSLDRWEGRSNVEVSENLPQSFRGAELRVQ